MMSDSDKIRAAIASIKAEALAVALDELDRYITVATDEAAQQMNEPVETTNEVRTSYHNGRFSAYREIQRKTQEIRSRVDFNA